MTANDRQVDGDHYKGQELEHWDIVHMFNLDYFQAQILRYVMRHKKKAGLKDLQKAQHFIEKYIELEYPHGVIVPQGEVSKAGLTLEQVRCKDCGVPWGFDHMVDCEYWTED